MTRRSFFVVDIDEQVFPLKVYLEKENIAPIYDRVRKRLLREYAKSALTQIFIPYNSTYITADNLLSVNRKTSDLPHPKQDLLFVFLEPETNIPVLGFGRWAKRADEVCRINIEKMSYSYDDGNTWCKIFKATSSGGETVRRTPFTVVSRCGNAGTKESTNS